MSSVRRQVRKVVSLDEPLQPLLTIADVCKLLYSVARWFMF